MASERCLGRRTSLPSRAAKADPTLRAENDANPVPTKNIIPPTMIVVEASSVRVEPVSSPLPSTLESTNREKEDKTLNESGGYSNEKPHEKVDKGG